MYCKLNVFRITYYTYYVFLLYELIFNLLLSLWCVPIYTIKHKHYAILLFEIKII